MMDKQHSQLTDSLYKKYIFILLISICSFSIALVLINSFTNTRDQQFSKHSVDQINQLKQIVSNAQIIGNTVNQLLFLQMGVNVGTTASFCGSGLGYQQCRSVQKQNEVNVIIQYQQGTSTSFRCLSGTCHQASYLADYLWTFRLKFPFINYFLITYTYNSTTSSLIAPSLAIQNVNLSSINIQTSWQKTYISNSLILSKQFNASQTTIHMVLDSGLLLFKYQVDLSKFDFSASSYQFSQEQIHLQLQSSIFYISLIALMIIFCVLTVIRVKKLINHWSNSNFKNLLALDSLYRYQLNCIFTGQQPHNSSILSQFSMSTFYQQLSQLIDNSITSLTVRQLQPQKQEPFKFIPLLQKIKLKYSQQIKVQQEERNKQLTDIKYQIKGAVSQITQHVSKRIKQTYARVRELHLTNSFFYHSYLSLLQPTKKFQQRLEKSKAALPQQIVQLLRYMNQTIWSDRIMFPFKFAGVFPKTIQQQLIMKLQFNLQQKYLSNIKELDFNLTHCKNLGLEKEIKYLQDQIDNKKYIFMIYLK